MWLAEVLARLVWMASDSLFWQFVAAMTSVGVTVAAGWRLAARILKE